MSLVRFTCKWWSIYYIIWETKLIWEFYTVSMKKISSSLWMQSMQMLTSSNQSLNFLHLYLMILSSESAVSKQSLPSLLLKVNIWLWWMLWNRQFDFVIFSMLCENWRYMKKKWQLSMKITKILWISLSIWFFISESSTFRFDIMLFGTMLKGERFSFNIFKSMKC